MTLKLYFSPGACSFVPHALLEIAHAQFEPLLVKLHKGEQKEASFRSINPRGQVPVLIDSEFVITQILAIVLHLDALFPNAQVLPTQGRARTKVLELLSWMNNTVHPTFTHIFMPQKFTPDLAAQEEIKCAALVQYTDHLKELERLVLECRSRGHAWLGGESVGAVDVYALTLARWGTLAQINPNETPHLWSFICAVSEHPAVARAVERERLVLNVFKG